MPAVATESIAVASAKLRRMVSLSDTFNAVWALAGDTDEQKAARALHHVLLKSLVGPDVPRPLAIVSMGDRFDWRIVSGGDQYDLRPSGSLMLYMTVDTDPAYYGDRVSAEWTAWNFLGGVVADIAALSCADDANSDFGESHLPITSISTIGWGENPREEWDTDGRFYEAAFTVEWGDE